MDAVSAGIGRYWRRKSGGYVRVNRSSGRRITQAQLGSGAKRRRWSWRIKIRPKVRFGLLIRKLSWSSPKKFLVWLRDAYVNMMLGVANSRVVTSGAYATYGGALGNGAAAFGRAPLKEYDEKMILEIYKSLVLARSHQLATATAGPLAVTPTARLAAISE